MGILLQPKPTCSVTRSGVSSFVSQPKHIPLASFCFATRIRIRSQVIRLLFYPPELLLSSSTVHDIWVVGSLFPIDTAFPPQSWANMGSNPTYLDYGLTWAPMQHGLRPDVFWDLKLKFHFEIENFIEISNLSPHPWFSGFSHVSHPTIFMFLKNQKCLQCSGRCYIVMHRAVQCKNISMFFFFVGIFSRSIG